MVLSRAGWIGLAAFTLAAALPAAPPRDRIVLAISIDGLRPDAWEQAEMPFLDRLAADGVVAKAAATVRPPVTLPSHASMITGVTPQVHGLLFNDHRERERLTHPTVFEPVRKAGYATVMVAAKAKFAAFRGPGLEHFEVPAYASESVAAAAILQLEAGRAGLYFVHFGEVDGAGHGVGWMSRHQLRVAGKVDRQLGRLVQYVSARKWNERVAWMVTADHGGKDQNHNLSIPETVAVPFVLAGAGVRAGAKLEQASVMDLAPTAAALLGVTIPWRTEGRVLREVLQER